jgi:hypothetical protein
LVFFWTWIEDVVGIEVNHQPDQDYHRKGDKSNLEIYLGKEWNQEYPENQVV